MKSCNSFFFFFVYTFHISSAKLAVYVNWKITSSKRSVCVCVWEKYWKPKILTDTLAWINRLSSLRYLSLETSVKWKIGKMQKNPNGRLIVIPNTNSQMDWKNERVPVWTTVLYAKRYSTSKTDSENELVDLTWLDLAMVSTKNRINYIGFIYTNVGEML